MPAYPLSFPTKVATSERLTLLRKQAVMQSPHSGAQQSVDNYAQWRLDYAWPRMSHAEGEVVAAWLDSLRGSIGTFRYAPQQSVISALTGRTLFVQAFAYASTMTIQGWSGSAASTIRQGQFFQIGDQLLRITSAPINATSGRVLVEFEPSLRINYAVGTAVTFVNPRGLFRLASADVTGFQLDPDRLPEFAPIVAMEAL